MEIINIVSKMNMSLEDSTLGAENFKGKQLTVS